MKGQYRRSGKIIVKFILYYLVAAVSMFVLLNTIGVKMLEKSILENRKKLLTEEAKMIHRLQFLQSEGSLSQ